MKTRDSGHEEHVEEAVNHGILSLFADIGFRTDDTIFTCSSAQRTEDEGTNACEAINHKLLSFLDCVRDDIFHIVEQCNENSSVKTFQKNEDKPQIPPKPGGKLPPVKFNMKDLVRHSSTRTWSTNSGSGSCRSSTVYNPAPEQSENNIPETAQEPRCSANNVIEKAVEHSCTDKQGIEEGCRPRRNDKDGIGKAEEHSCTDKQGIEEGCRPRRNDKDGIGKAEEHSCTDKEEIEEGCRPSRNDKDGIGKAVEHSCTDKQGIEEGCGPSRSDKDHNEQDDESSASANDHSEESAVSSSSEEIHDHDPDWPKRSFSPRKRETTEKPTRESPSEHLAAEQIASSGSSEEGVRKSVAWQISDMYPSTQTTDCVDYWDTDSVIYESCSWLVEEPYYKEYQLSSARSLEASRSFREKGFAFDSMRRDVDAEPDFVVLESLMKIPWRAINRVVDCNVTGTLSRAELAMYAVKFEILTTEKSLHSHLATLKSHFIRSDALNDTATLSRSDHSALFSPVKPSAQFCKRFLRDLGKCWQQSIYLTGIFDLICEYFTQNKIFTSYSLMLTQVADKLASLKSTNKKFCAALTRLENSDACSKLELQIFLDRPLKRITDLYLLLTRARAVMLKCHAQATSPELQRELQSCLQAYDLVKSICVECNKKTEEKERVTELLALCQQLEFPAHVPRKQLVDNVRGFVMQADAVCLGTNENVSNSKKIEMNFKKAKSKLTLFLLTDLLLLTERKKKKSGAYTVVDYCARCDVTVASKHKFLCVDERLMADTAKELKLFLIMKQNHRDKRLDMLLSMSSKEERDKWRIMLDSCVTLESAGQTRDYVCVYPYRSEAFQLEPGDEVAVSRTTDTGWMEGVRKKDGRSGSFPSSRVDLKQ